MISHTEALQDAAAIVDGLATAQKISAGSANALNVKLSNAVRSISDGNVDDAVEKLEGTIDQVSSLVASRRLTAADAAPLQDLLNRVIQSLLDDQVTVLRSTSFAAHLPRR